MANEQHNEREIIVPIGNVDPLRSEDCQKNFLRQHIVRFLSPGDRDSFQEAEGCGRRGQFGVPSEGKG